MLYIEYGLHFMSSPPGKNEDFELKHLKMNYAVFNEKSASSIDVAFEDLRKSCQLFIALIQINLLLNSPFEMIRS